jgi:DNA-binding transcriptional LysR family regulator
MAVDTSLSNQCHDGYSKIGMSNMTHGNETDLRVSDFKVLSLVLRERSITRAADALRTTQPSVSKVLARLRSYFDDPLFIRNGHALQPTPRALEIMEPLRNLLLAADTMRTPKPNFNPRASKRIFGLLSSDVGMARFLAPLTSRLAAEGADLSLRSVPLATRHFESKLESGEADLAIGAFPKAPPGLRRQRLYFDTYLSVARKDHPRLQRLRTRSGFSAAHHAVVVASETGHANHQVVQQALEDEVAAANIALRLPSFVIAALVASRTETVATIPAHVATLLADQLGLATFRPPIPLPPIEIAQYWHEIFHRDPANRWFRSLTFELFAKSRR